MPITKKQVSKYIPLSLPKELDDGEKKELQDLIGEYLVSEVLQFVSSGNSPVKGEGSFQKLNKKYADTEKGGDRTSNLELNGDMLTALTYEFNQRGINIGVFDPDQAIKLYNHNVGDTLPKRQVIPDSDEDFKAEIMDGIDSIIMDYLSEKI